MLQVLFVDAQIIYWLRKFIYQKHYLQGVIKLKQIFLYKKNIIYFDKIHINTIKSIY